MGEPLAAAIRNSHVEHLDKAWDGFYEKTMKKYKKKNSLARNMVRQIASKLRSNHGLLTVRGKKVSITGQTLGLRSTPDAEKKFLGAKLKKVLTMAKTLSVKKKKNAWLTINDQRGLWGSSCVDDEAFGEG